MNLGFRTKWPNGEPTYFTQKIWTSLLIDLKMNLDNYNNYLTEYMNRFSTNIFYYNSNDYFPKKHTIREDKPDRWKAGNKIHFVINNRTKNRFQFAPVIPVISTQTIRIECPTEYLNDQKIYVDDKLLNLEQMQKLAYNDGFENLAAFQLWFNTDFTGKIIHWTNLKY